MKESLKKAAQTAELLLRELEDLRNSAEAEKNYFIAYLIDKMIRRFVEDKETLEGLAKLIP
jgi:hypothetical protein